ncbi:MAG: SusC/RagA family TonB-linked outer membrane protein [Bacteroidales bacterium]
MRKFTLILVMCFALFSSAYAQKTITGKVIDESGLGIPGVAVVQKGTTIGSITDVDGKFSVSVPEGAILQFSFMGMKTHEVTVGSEGTINISMEPDAIGLEEVVAIGYGTQKKVNVVGSIASIDSKKLENRVSSSVVSSLTGQMTGVTITQAGGRPGEQTGTIRVRGVGSFGATPDALVLIDGIPGNMTDLNPNDIESVSVLKDAATAAIYGARAANGVILVTTKKGKEGKVVVSYNGYAGVNRATVLPEYVDSWDYARLSNIAEGITLFTDDDIQAMKDGSMPDVYANEKFVDDIFSGNGFQTGHSLSLNGGGKKSQYFASFGYLSQNGIVPGNNYSRHTGRVTLTSHLNDKVKMTARLRGDNSKVEEPGIAGSMDGSGMMGLIQQGLRYPGYNQAY